MNDTNKEQKVHFKRYVRKWAMQLLFQIDVSNDFENTNILTNIKEEIQNCDLLYLEEEKYYKRVQKLTLKIIEGIINNKKEIDELINKFSEKWNIERMDIVDRNILRTAIYEMLYMDNIPLLVSIDEAIEIAKEFGAENSSVFINGILNAVKDKIINTNPDRKIN